MVRHPREHHAELHVSRSRATVRWRQIIRPRPRRRSLISTPATRLFRSIKACPAPSPNRNVTAYFTAPTGSWSIQNTIYGWVSPLFSGNFLYPGAAGDTLAIQFSDPITNIDLNFVTADLTTAGDVPHHRPHHGLHELAGHSAHRHQHRARLGVAQRTVSRWPTRRSVRRRRSTSSSSTSRPKAASPAGGFFVDNIVVQRVLAAPTNVTITTSAFPSSGGTTAGDGTFTNGASVTVTATTNAGYTFLNWTESGAPVSTSASYTFTATNSRILTANFAPAYNIAVSASPSNGGRATGGGIYFEGANVPLTGHGQQRFHLCQLDGSRRARQHGGKLQLSPPLRIARSSPTSLPAGPSAPVPPPPPAAPPAAAAVTRTGPPSPSRPRRTRATRL